MSVKSRSVLKNGSDCLSTGRPRSAAAPSVRNAGSDARENGCQPGDEAVDVGGDGADVVEHRRELVGQAAEAVHGRAQLAQERRQAPDRLLQRGAALGGRLGRLLAVDDEPRDARALRGPGARAPGRSSRARSASTWFCPARIWQRPCRAPAAPGRRCGSPGAGRRRWPASPVPSSLMMMRRRCAVRAGARCCRRGRGRPACWCARSAAGARPRRPPLDLARWAPGAAARRPGLGQRALDELLADRATAAGSRSVGVPAEVLEAGLVDAQDQRRLVFGRDRRATRPCRPSRRPPSRPRRGDEGRVDEDRADAVGAAVAVARPLRMTTSATTTARTRERWTRTRLMAPGGTWPGRRSSVPAAAHGTNRPAAVWVAAPGQRRSWPFCRPSYSLAGGSGRSSPPWACRRTGRSEERRDAGVVAVGVVVGRALAEVAQPADRARARRAGMNASTGMDLRSALRPCRERRRADPRSSRLRAQQVGERRCRRRAC